MGEQTNIAWTDHTFNIAWGCEKISPGCKNCYADSVAHRYGWHLWEHRHKLRRVFKEKHWAGPLKWNERAAQAGIREKVFCSSMCDVFEEHPTIDRERKKMWDLIAQTPSLDWQILTKRAHRIAGNLPDDWGEGYPNVWLGVSIETDTYAFRFNDHLLHIPAVVRFISYEPALGPLTQVQLPRVDWLIYGGESGPRFRPDDRAWARAIRNDCRAAGVAFFHKQSAALEPGTGAALDGEIIQEFPVVRGCR